MATKLMISEQQRTKKIPIFAVYALRHGFMRSSDIFSIRAVDSIYHNQHAPIEYYKHSVTPNVICFAHASTYMTRYLSVVVSNIEYGIARYGHAWINRVYAFPCTNIIFHRICLFIASSINY